MHFIQPLPLADILLTRLLISDEKGLTQSQLKDAVKPILTSHFSASELTKQVEAALLTLTQEGHIEAISKARYRLTNLGHQYALVLLNLPALPKKSQWPTLKNTYLLARALNLPAFPSDQARQRFADADGLRATILRLHFNLPIEPFPTLTTARNTLLWQQVFDPTVIEKLKAQLPQLRQQPFNQGVLMGLLLNDLLAADQTLQWEKALSQLVAKIVNARRTDPDELRLSILRQAFSQSISSTKPDPDPDPEPVPESAPIPAPIAIPTFAETVIKAAKATKTGWFGDHKVFISHVWQTWQSQENVTNVTLEDFKKNLREANRQHLLTLSRADMAHALDSQDVDTSEIVHQQSTYHFICLD